MIDIQEIKNQTRLALPKDDMYLFRVGVALYGFASVNSFMTEIICHIDGSQNRVDILDKMSGQVLKKFRDVLSEIKEQNKFPEIYETMEATANLFEKLNDERIDFVHAYPITNKEGQQILHRRKDTVNKYFEVDNSFLDSFIQKLELVNTGLYEIRDIVKEKL